MQGKMLRNCTEYLYSTKTQRRAALFLQALGPRVLNGPGYYPHAILIPNDVRYPSGVISVADIRPHHFAELYRVFGKNYGDKKILHRPRPLWCRRCIFGESVPDVGES